MAGDVIVNDHRADKAGQKFSFDDAIRIRENSHPYVSRGGVKLAHALKLWPQQLTDAIAMDVGASTGGFTDVLLQNGARLVYAIDVGYGQLAIKLRDDPRVKNLERVHIGKLKKGELVPVPSIATIDVSFISLTKVLPVVLDHLSTDAVIYALIKPQFEAGRELVEKGGLVKDAAVHQQVLDHISSVVHELGLTIMGIAESPILGMKGNKEFLMALTTDQKRL